MPSDASTTTTRIQPLFPTSVMPASMGMLSLVHLSRCTSESVNAVSGSSGFGQNRSAEPGRSLEELVSIHEVGVAVASESNGLDQSIEHLGINGCPENPGCAVFPTSHGDDEVRIVTVPHEHVADVFAFEQGLLEPLFVMVIDVLERVGADICGMVSRAVD